MDMESQIVHVVDLNLKVNSFAAQNLKIIAQITFLIGQNSKVFHRIAARGTAAPEYAPGRTSKLSEEQHAAINEALPNAVAQVRSKGYRDGGVLATDQAPRAQWP